MGAHSAEDPATPSDPDARDVERVMNAVRSIVRALRVNTRGIEQSMGISLAQLFVLQQLAERPADSLNDLADRTATHQSSVSVVVRRLVEAGLVSRAPADDDRRRIHIALTPAGLAKLADAPSTVQERLMRGVMLLEPEQRRALPDLLEQWLRDSAVDFATPPMLFEESGDTN